MEKVPSSPLSESASEFVSWSELSTRDLFAPSAFALVATECTGMDNVDMIVIKAESEQISTEKVSLFNKILM